MSATISIIARNTNIVTEHNGKTVESITRRLYGKKAIIRLSADRNAPEVGIILTPAINGGWNIQAQVFTILGDHEEENF